MTNRTVITSKGLQLLSKASASGENSYWIGYYGLAYVPEESRGVGGVDYLSSSTSVLTKNGDHIYNVWQGSMTPVGFDTNTSAASDLYNKCLYTSNVMARYRYVLDENGKNNLVMWRGTTDSSSYKLTGAAVYRGIGATTTDGKTVETSQMPIPAPLFYLGEPTNFKTPKTESELVDAVKYPNSSEDFPVFNSLPSVSTDTRDYTASSSNMLNPPDESGKFDDFGTLDGKYEWTAAEKTYTQDGDAQDDAPIAEDENKYCQQYWKYQSISNFNRFHAPASSEGYSVDYEPSCRNMAKATKYFPISYYKVLNVEGGNSETGSTASSTATSLQFTVNISLKDLNNTVANRTNTAEIEVAEGHESGIKDADGNDLFTTRTASVKFNRVGIYAVPMTVHRFATEYDDGSCSGTKIQFEIMGDAEPVLFAVSDIDEVTVKEGGGIDSWKIDFVLNLTDATDEGAILRDTSIFYNMYEDDAITWYKNQLIATASLSEAVMNQAIEINYLKNMIGNMSSNSSNCSTVSSSDQWAKKNHTHPYMKNIVDSSADGNGAARGIYTKEEGSSIVAYNTTGVKAYKCNGNVLAVTDNGFYRYGKYTTSGQESLMSDSDVLELLNTLGISKFASDIASGLSGYYVSTDGAKDIEKDTSGSTQYDASHIYIQARVASDSNKLGVIVISTSDGTYEVVKNADVSSMENSDLNPQYLAIVSNQLSESDATLKITNYTAGDKSMTLGEDSASAGDYNLNISRNGLIDENSDYNILAGGTDTTQDETVDHITLTRTNHSIVMGGKYSNEVSSSENIIAMIDGESNSVKNSDNSLLMLQTDENTISIALNSIAILGEESNAGSIKYSLLLNPSKIVAADKSIVVNGGVNDDDAHIYSSILVGISSDETLTRTLAMGRGTMGATVSNIDIAKAMTPTFIATDITNSIFMDTDSYSVQYGSLNNSVILNCETVGTLDPREYIPYNTDDKTVTFSSKIQNSIVNGGKVHSDVTGVMGIGANTYFPSRSNGVIEIGGCAADMTQRSDVEFITVDELNELYGEQSPSTAFNGNYNTIVVGTGTLSLKNADGSVFEKAVKGMSLYVIYDNTNGWRLSGADFNSSSDEFDYYAHLYTTPSNWNNLLLLGAGANAGVNSENSIFVGENSSWVKTTFKNSFINTLGSDGGSKYSKYSKASSSSTIWSNPNTIFDNVWWIGHTSSTDGDSTNGAFSIPLSLSGTGYDGSDRGNNREFKDAFVFIGSNDKLFNHAYWYGVDSDTMYGDGPQPYKTPMIFTGGIALGGAGSHDCNFAMMKIGCSRVTVSKQAALYEDYPQAIISYGGYNAAHETTDPIQLVTYSYAGVEHKLMHSPHAGKCLVVQDLQELDGTLHVGLGYPTDTYGNSLLGGSSSLLGMTRQYLVRCSYASGTTTYSIDVCEPDNVTTVTYSHSTSEIDIPEGQTSATVTNTIYDPDIGMSFTTAETLNSENVYSVKYTIRVKPKNNYRYFFPISYSSPASNHTISVEFCGADKEGVNTEVFMYSQNTSSPASLYLHGATLHSGGGVSYSASNIYFPGGGFSPTTSSEYAYYYHLTSVKTVNASTSEYYTATSTCTISGDIKGEGTEGSETWTSYPFAIHQLYGSDTSSLPMIIIK